MRSALYTGVVMHARQTPARNVFRYRVAAFLIDLDEIGELNRRLRLLGIDSAAPITLHRGDHLGDPQRSIKENVLAFLAEHDVDLAGGRVQLLTNLRIFGYVFNPISVFYCHGAAGDLRAVVAEVGNTFGERHLYLLDERCQVRAGRRRAWQVDKQMHVSPFFGLDQRYEFALTEPDENVFVGVTVSHDGDKPFHATLTGRRHELTDATLAWSLLRHPLMPQRVTALIHWQAIRLALKRVPFHPKPAFRIGDGSIAPKTAQPARRGLKPPPPARRSPLAPITKALTLFALTRPERGSIALRTPEGRVRRHRAERPGPHVDIAIHAPNQLYRRLAVRGMTGIGESYVAGDWDAEDLPSAMESLLRRGEEVSRSRIGRLTTGLRTLRPSLPDRFEEAIARRRIGYHYDLGNDFYTLFLDDSLTYSCAVFDGPDDTLEAAQHRKHRMICDRLLLGPDDHLLEVGCGWGAFAQVAAGDFGARVTGVTLSNEQHDMARERLAAAGLGGRTDIRLDDYRTLEGTFSRIASTEMIEAVPHHELPGYFGSLDRLLAPDGLVCIQAIAIPDQRYERYRRSRDWISEYIFPGGNVPSLKAMLDAITKGSSLMVNGVEDIGIHYAETLRRWRLRFEANREAVLALGFDETFIRGWRFYLATCEAAFRARSIHVYQLVLTRPFNDGLPGIEARRHTGAPA